MRDPKVEQVLNSNSNLAWEYLPSIPLSKVDEKKSHANQARIDDPIDRDLLNEYKNSMQAGDEFPAVVVFPDGDNYVISDGNHRIAAKVALNKRVTDAYLVLTDNPVERSLLTFEWNPLNGKPTNSNDRDHQAVFLVKQGITQVEAAKRLHLPRHRVEDAMAEDAGHTLAVTLGIKSPWAKISSRSGRVRIYRAVGDIDSVFAATVRYASRFQLTERGIRDFVTEVLVNRSERERVEFINSKTKALVREQERLAKEKAQSRNGRSRRKPPKIMFEANLVYVEKVITEQFAEVVANLTQDEINLLRSRMQKTHSKLGTALANL